MNDCTTTRTTKDGSEFPCLNSPGHKGPHVYDLRASAIDWAFDAGVEEERARIVAEIREHVTSLVLRIERSGTRMHPSEFVALLADWIERGGRDHVKEGR